MAFLLDHTAHCASSCCYWSFWNQQEYSKTGTLQALQFLSMFLYNMNLCSILKGGYLVQLQPNTVSVEVFKISHPVQHLQPCLFMGAYKRSKWM